ncbi:MFS transporter [Microlunatus sp. GCM10028923]|uniref:MFS transporter n=1 Tax=Microlunatus sp. GCM10028923 TaxID=3273400 RepID=UPI00361A2792
MSEPIAQQPPTEPRSAWRNSDFVKVWGAQASGLVGQQFSVLAMPLVAILTLDASPATVALMVASFNVPWVLVGLFVGVAVDRWPRRSVLIFTDLARALMLLSIPVCAWLGVLSIPQLFALGFIIGTLDVFWLTAFRSYVPAVVETRHLSQAYSLIGASDSVTRTAAPSLAGGAVQLIGAPLGLAVTSLAYLGSAILNATIRRREPPRQHEDHEPVLKAFLDGLRYTARHKLVLAMACSNATYTFFWALLESVLLVFLARQLGLPPATIGLIFTIGTLGGLLGAATARGIGRRFGIGRSLLIGSTLRSIGIAGTAAIGFLAADPGLGAIIGLMAARAVNSFGWTLWEIHHETTQQRLITDEVRGRVSGSVLFLSGTMLALGSATGALVVSQLGLVPTLLVGGIGTLLAIAWIARPRFARATDQAVEDALSRTP